MKKARIMLAAIAVFAIVGGSLAFKAQRNNSVGLYKFSATNGNLGKCTFTELGLYTTVNPTIVIDYSLKATSGVTTCTTSVAVDN